MKVTKTAVLAGISLGVMTGGASAIGRERDSLRAVSPIDVYSGSELETVGMDGLVSLRSVTPSLSGVGHGGPSNIDLRGLGGANQTLVLVDGRRFAGGLGIGHDGDPTNNGSDSTEYVDLELLAGHVFDTKRGMIGVTLGLNAAQWGDDLDNADQDDTTYDLNLAYASLTQFSPRFALNSASQFHYGDSASLEAGFLKSGVLENEVFNWSTRSTADYRFSGALGDAGWEFSTYYGSVGYLESTTDLRDSKSYTLGQEIRYNLNDSTAVFVGGEFGTRNFEDWDAYDSDSWRGLGGIRMDGDGWTADAAVGYESYDYDDRDDQDGIMAQIGYTRKFSDRFSFNMQAKYGTQEVFVNVGGPDMVDPNGLLFGSSLVATLNDRHTVALTCNVMDVDSEFSSDDFSRESLGLDWSWQLNDSLTIRPSVLWTAYDGAGTDDSFSGRVGVYRTW